MPIEVFLKFKASKTAIRLKIEKNWDSLYPIANKCISHAKFLDKEIDKLGTAGHIPLIDRTSNSNLMKTYSVTLNYPQVPPHDSVLQIYTDGSRQCVTQRTGAGFIMMRNNRIILEQSISLGSSVTINQSEMYAIQKAAEILCEASTKNQVIMFFSDSRSSLQQLNNEFSSSKLTIETSKLLNKLNEHNQVSLYKVAAHTGVSGNERADSLAKEGAKANPTGPEPFLCLSWNNVISELLNKAKKETLTKIAQLKIKEETKTPIESYIQRYGLNRIANKKKNTLILITHMCSGQNWLKNNLSKRDPTTDATCEQCGTGNETAQHFISTCPAYTTVRLSIFGTPTISLPDIIRYHGTAKLIQYINKTGRTKVDYYPSN